MTLSFFQNVAAGATENLTVDLSQCASLVGRRFYRQGILWAVNSVKVLTSSANVPLANITLQKLPHSWVFSNAWEKGFRAWQEMNNKAVEESDQQSLKGKFLDFKIYMDSIHHQSGYANNLLPVSSAGAYVAGEWIPSEIIVPNSSTPGSSSAYELVGVGGNYPGAGASGRDAVSLIDGYANSRALPGITDPNVPGDSDDAAGVTPENWLVGMFNEGTTQDSAVIQNMTEYDQPPYPYENDGINIDTMYPNGPNQGNGLEIHDSEFVTGTTIGGTSLFKGGMFPCGLMRFNVVNQDLQDALAVTILVDLVPGDHRGYLCTPMTEM